VPRLKKESVGTHPELGLPEVRKLWQTVGLFSDHYLKARIQKNNWWPADEQVRPLWEFCRDLYNKRYVACAKNNEEFTRQELIEKILDKLGFPWTRNLDLPEGQQDLEPDYILYPDAETKERVIDKSRAARYRAANAILEAKKVNHPLSQISKHQQRYPHQQIRDYLSEAQVLSWGILTNGNEWRLYCRDAKPSEFFGLDFGAAIQSLEHLKYFLALFSPAALVRDAQGKCRLDEVRESALSAQTELEADLRERIFTILEVLANGFAERHENNIADAGLARLCENCLIFLYRLLFILYAEGRQLLPVEPKSRKYHKDLSLARLIPALKDFSHDSRTQTRLYREILELCRVINGTNEKANREYAVPRYNGGLFDPGKYPELEQWAVCDAVLADVLRQIMFTPEKRGQKFVPLETVDYADLSVQQLGSIYEGLLEHHLVRDDGKLTLKTDKGERKATGTYYTPDYIVKYIVENTLGPLITEIENREPVKAARAAGRQDNSFADEVLRLNVLDPAMGSGHFLVEATNYLADQIVYHPTTKFQAEFVRGESQEQAEIAYWRRRVVEACIYGVDLNPLAVELAKLSLWLATIASDQPLNFLDHHLRCGNSLIGARLDDLGDLPETRKWVLKEAAQACLLFGLNLKQAVSNAIRTIHKIESEPSDDVGAVKEKEFRWQCDVLPALAPYKAIADLWTATRFGFVLDQETYTASANRILKVGYREDYTSLVERDDSPGDKLTEWRDIAAVRRFFHWELEFPEIFFNDDGSPKENPGFDAVIGNPPYGAELGEDDRAFFQSFYVTGQGYKNTALHFIESAYSHTRTEGRCGLILPKSLTFSEGWRTGRDLLLPGLEKLADVSKAFEGVLLEQVVSVSSKRPGGDSHYATGSARRGKFSHEVCVERELCRALNGLLIGIDAKALSVFTKMMQSGVSFRDLTRTFRGLPLQKRLRPSGTHKVFRGDHIARYMLMDSSEFVAANDLSDMQAKVKMLEQPKIVSQNIVAHVTKPREHIIITSAFDPDGNLNLDTVNNTVCHDPNYRPLFLLCLLNSKVISWFAYVFIYNQAIRTMHFDEAYIGKLPIPRIHFETARDERERIAKRGRELYQRGLQSGDTADVLSFVGQELDAGRSDVAHDLLVCLAERITELNREKHTSTNQFLADLKDFHGIDAHLLTPKTKLRQFWKLESADLFAHLRANAKNLAAHRTRVKEADEDSIRNSFERARRRLCNVEAALTLTDNLIDRIVYRLYGLTNEDVQITET
jgi:hypothetical protein